MKFIVDAQLPKTLSDLLNEWGYDSTHTLDLPDANKSKPKKLLLVTTGNVPNSKLLEIFIKNIEIMIEMLSKSNLIEISKTEIIEQE